MSMHLIRGVQVHGKSKVKKKPGWKAAQDSHNEWLRSMGIDPNKKTKRKAKKLDTRPVSKNNATSDVIPGNGSKKDSIKYTGNEIAGIVVTHKSNLMPIRKDNKQAAVDAATMRRN